MFKKRFNFAKICKVHELPLGTIVDLVVIIKEAPEPVMITLKNTGEQKPKRSIQVYDESQKAIEIVKKSKLF